MRQPFCCDASRSLYDDYYVKQSSNGLPVFHGARMQRGQGLSSILNGLFIRAWPVIQSGAKAFGKQFLKTCLQVANDVLERQTFKELFMKRVREGIESSVSSKIFDTQNSSGRKRPPAKRLLKRA